jgi:arabinogalactan oligomer/maltooligosaccharide transport system substrate-binding protein
MSKKNWRKYALGLVTATSAIVLAACGGGGEETSGNEDTGAGGNGNGEVLEVGIDPNYTEFIEEIAPAFEEETGVSIEITEGDMFDTLEALPLDGPSGLAPDVFIAPYDRVGGLGQQGHLTPVTLPEDGRYDETDVQQVTVNNEQFAYPFVIESLVMYTNNELINEIPATFEDLEALTQDNQFAFDNEEGTNVGFLANWVDFYNSYGLVAGFGGYVFGEDGTDTSDVGLNTPEAIEGIEYATTWFQDVWPEGMLDVTSSGDFINQSFTSGDTAAIIGGPWEVEEYRNSDLDFTVSAIPTLPNGEEYAPFAGGKAWAISSYTENVEVAEQWLEYVTNEANQTLQHTDYRGEVPANQQARDTILEDGSDELSMAVIEQYNNSIPMPNIPEMAEVWTGAETMMFDAGSGNKTPEEAANDTVEIIEQNIEQTY